MSTISSFALAIVAAAALSIGSYRAEASPTLKRGEASAIAAPPDTVRLKIDGMTCGGCAVSARIVLQRLGGVAKAAVDYDTKIAVVVFDPKVVMPERMIRQLKEKLKYTAVVVTPQEQGK